MSISVKLVEPTHDILQYLADNMRESDVKELKASSGHDPLTVMVMGVQASEYSHVFAFDDVPVGIIGLAILPQIPEFGSPWMVGTDGITKNPVTFIKLMKEEMSRMISVRQQLINYVHVENKESIRFLSLMGFTIGEPEVFGVAGELFRKFYKGIDNV